MSDARFEDGRDTPLQLWATDVDDLRVLSALVQDAVLPVTELRYDRAARRFAVLLNRFRWEEAGAPPERVQSLLVVRDVLGVASQGLDRKDRDLILSLLALEFEAGADGAGHLVLRLAGDGDIRLSVECLDVALRDVTRPYMAPSGKTPAHDLKDE